MKRQVYILIAAFLYLALTASDCKKSTDPDTTAPSIPAVTFNLPGQQDACSAEASSYVAFINAYAGQLSVFASLPATNSGNDYTWQITLDSLTVTVKSTRQSDGSFAWEVKYNGTEDGITYSNKVMLSGSTSADNKSGSFTAYDDATPAVVGTLVYSTSSAGVLTGTLEGYDNGTAASRYVVVSNAGNTGGEVTTFHMEVSGWIQDFHSTWTSNGGQATCN